MKIKPSMMSILLTAVMLGGIFFSDMLGLWITESSKEPAKYTTGENSGQYDPSDIRGSYSFEDINRAFKIPIEDLGTAFEVTDNIAAFQCKGLEEAYSDAAAAGYEIGTDSVRLFVAIYLNLPYEPEDTYLPESASALLKAKIDLDREQLEYLEVHTYSISGVSSELEPVQPSPTEKPAIQNPQPTPPTENTVASEDRLVKGKTTFNEVLGWGVSQEEIHSVLGKPYTTEAMTIRDFCSREGIEFSDVKAQLQAIIDQK